MDRQALANMLRDQMEAERICYNRLLEVCTSQYLTAEEKLHFLEQAKEEVLHERMFENCLKQRYSDVPNRAYEGPLAYTKRSAKDCSEDGALRLADFRSIERLIVRSMKSAAKLFEAAGDEKTAAVFRAVIADEESTRHGKGNAAVFERLRTDSPIADELTKRYQWNIKNHYTKQLYGQAVNS